MRLSTVQGLKRTMGNLLDERRTIILLNLFFFSVSVSDGLLNGSTSLRNRQENGCPNGCSCSQNWIVNCSMADLETAPAFPSFVARTLILDDNRISYLDANSLGPSNGSSLEGLSVRRNNLSIIDDNTFRQTTGLRHLYLDNNHISFLPPTLFQTNHQLQLLSLASNPISGNDSLSFLAALGSSLKDLDVSGTFVGASQRLPDVFSTLTSLQDLTMQNLFLNITSGFFDSLAVLDLQTLDLSASVIKNVDEDAFDPLGSLRDLQMANVMANVKAIDNMFRGLGNSSIEKINMQGVFVYDEYLVEHDLFRHLKGTKLRELNFAGNYIGLRAHVLTKLFHPLKSLRKLRLDDCDLASLPRETFHGLHDLKILTLRRNLLSCTRGSNCGFLIPEHPMRHLEILDISDNRISEVENTVLFDGTRFPGLVSLSLRRNQLTSIPKSMFEKLKKLTQLDISENPIEKLDAEVFSQLESLTRLDLEGCRQLTHIKQDAFKGLIQLVVLNLQNGALVHVHHAALTYLIHLEELYLRSNRLGVGSDGITKVMIKKSSLKILDLGKNELTKFPKGLLSNGFHLRRLLLDGNRLSHCAALIHSEEALKQLEILDLSYNSFVDTSVTCFEGLTGLRTFDLSSNPFYCSCKTRELADWITKRRISLRMEPDYVCSGPDPFSGTNVFQLTIGNFECYWKYGVVCGVLVALLLMATLVILVLCIRQSRSTKGKDENAVSAGNSLSVDSEQSAGVGGCSVFGKSAPYSPLEEEELSSRVVSDRHDLSTNGKYRSPLATEMSPRDDRAHSVTQTNAVTTSSASRKPSKCNGFGRTKTRKQGGTPFSSSSEDAVMQTRALVHDAYIHGDDDLCSASACFTKSHSAEEDQL